MDSYKKRKILFFIQILLTFVVFGFIYLGSVKVIPYYSSWIALAIYLVLMIYRGKFTRDNFVIQKVNRTKTFQMVVSLIPFAGVLMFFFLPAKNGLNVLGAAICFSLSIIIEDKFTVYTTKEEWKELVEKKKKKKKEKKEKKDKKKKKK